MGLVAIQCYLVGSFKSLVEKAKRITIIDLSSFSWNVFTVILTYYITLVALRRLTWSIAVITVRNHDLMWNRDVAVTLVGSLFGGVAGDSIWPESKGGYIGGVIVGGISGVIFSVVVFEYSLPDLCGKSVTDYFSNWIDVIGSIVSGSLIRERMFQALLTAFERQFEEFEMRFGAVENIFDVGGKKGLSEDSVAKIPKITVTSDNNVDTSGEKVSCSVCLQDFELGETVRSLPHCHHMFHVPCIDKWLIRHGSCPLCRRDL